MNWRSTLTRYKLHHLLGWLLLYAGWVFFRYEDYPGKVWLITLIKVADLMVMVYITNYILIPRLLYRHKYLLFFLLFITLIPACSILKMSLEEKVFGSPGFFEMTTRMKARIYDNILPHFLLVSTAAAIKLLVDYARAQRRIGELAKEKAETELQFLRSQINPHILFNSLNAIYFLIDRENTKARDTLLQFSDLLRYQLYDCNQPSIAIEKEIAYLHNYVGLQQLRRDEHYEVKIEAGDEVKGFSIAPLLLLPLVENAFKHISHHLEKTNFVHIRLSAQACNFTLEVVNSTDPSPTKNQPGGIGLPNVKRRLELLYPGKHQLEINNENDVYVIRLQLNLKN